jgi:hypothetical protein
MAAAPTHNGFPVQVHTFVASLLCLAADPQRDEDDLDVVDQSAVP